MSSNISFAQLSKKLRAISVDMEQFVKDETEAVGRDIENDAKDNASRILNAPPELKQRISSQVLDGGFTTRVSQNFLPLGAYIEFGTGAFVEVSDEWREMALTFYKNGKGTLRAHPYLYPAFTLNREKYIETLKKKLKSLSL